MSESDSPVETAFCIVFYLSIFGLGIVCSQWQLIGEPLFTQLVLLCFGSKLMADIHMIAIEKEKRMALIHTCVAVDLGLLSGFLHFYYNRFYIVPMYNGYESVILGVCVFFLVLLVPMMIFDNQKEDNQ